MLSVKASYLKYGAVRVKAGVMQRNDPHYKMIHGHFSTLRNDPWVIPLRREMTRGSFCNGGHFSALHRLNNVSHQHSILFVVKYNGTVKLQETYTCRKL